MSQRGTVDRWSLSSWLLYRPDHGNASLANAGQLGASQVGARLAYDLSPKAAYSLAMHARVTSALQSPLGTEAALGMTWRPARSLRSEEHTSELQSLMRISYAVFCLKKKKLRTPKSNDDDT